MPRPRLRPRLQKSVEKVARVKASMLSSSASSAAAAAAFVTCRDRCGGVGMQPRRLRQVGRLLVVQVPEAPRQAVHQSDRACRELVAGGLQAEVVELLVRAQECL